MVLLLLDDLLDGCLAHEREHTLFFWLGSGLSVVVLRLNVGLEILWNLFQFNFVCLHYIIYNLSEFSPL